LFQLLQLRYLFLKIVKNRLRNKMQDEFLVDCLIIYIEQKFDKDCMIDEFYDKKEQHIQLK